MLGDVETYYENGQWHSRIQGQARPFATGGTKNELVEQGRERAWTDHVEHIIENMDGTIGERNSYRRDPRNVSS